MKRIEKTLVFGMLALLILILSGCNSHQPPVYTSEVIYQKENYRSPYAYQIYHSVLEEKPYRIEIFGMNLAMTQYDYHTVLNSDGSFTSPIMKSLKDVMYERRTEWESSLSEEDKKAIGPLSGECKVLELENATYILSYDREDGEKNYTCYLFKSVVNEDIQFVKFEVEYSVMSYSSNQVELFAVYDDETLCVGDAIWFDENLNQIDKPKISKDEYLLSEDMLVDQMLKSSNEQVQALASETIYIVTEGRIGNMYYCFFSVPQNGDWGVENYYIAECEMEGDILSIVKIGGFETGYSVIPKKLDDEGYKYYDVKH